MHYSYEGAYLCVVDMKTHTRWSTRYNAHFQPTSNCAHFNLSTSVHYVCLLPNFIIVRPFQFQQVEAGRVYGCCQQMGWDGFRWVQQTFKFSQNLAFAGFLYACLVPAWCRSAEGKCSIHFASPISFTPCIVESFFGVFEGVTTLTVPVVDHN